MSFSLVEIIDPKGLFPNYPKPSLVSRQLVKLNHSRRPFVTFPLRESTTTAELEEWVHV